MAQILRPFLRSNVVVDSETINILGAAFEDAWRRIEASGSRFARPAYANAAGEVVARHIIDMAQCGEREPIKLSDSGVECLAANYKD